MSRKTIQVTLPVESPDELVALGETLVAKHGELGNDSPLDAGKMTLLGQLIAVAKKANSDMKDFDAKARTQCQLRDTKLGIADGQSVTTPGTAANLINYARKQLLVTHEGHEELLGEYGFDVVIGTAKSPARKNGNGQPH